MIEAKERAPMSDAYVIEVQGITAGIIVRKHQNEDGFRFLASLHLFNSLEGREFANPYQAESAASKLFREAPRSLRRQAFAKAS
jgi:hypothetical protein